MIFENHSSQIDHFLTVQYPPYLFKLKVLSMKIIVTMTVFIMERKNTNIERSRHHSRYSSTLWKKISGSFTTRIIYCNIVFVTSLETLSIEWSVETWEDLENQPELCVMIAV